MPLIEPSSDKQARFWASTADVLLYGGSAGGGKSFGLVVDALGLSYPKPLITFRDYNVLIIRKTKKELDQMLSEANKLYPKVDPSVVYHRGIKTFIFGSGARICFFQCRDNVDVEKHQGVEYSYIGIDEVGLYPNDYIFRFLLGRLRNTSGLPVVMRMTSNPSRYKWLKELFRIGPDGASTKFELSFDLPNGKKITKKYEYIQSKLEDNKKMDYDSYAANILQMSEEHQKAWLFGRWDSYDTEDGLIYIEKLNRAIKENRVCNIPYDKAIDLYLFSDVGRDGGSILFVQFVGKEIRIINEIFNTNIDISFYVEQLKQLADQYGYKPKLWVLPWDAANRNISSPYSLQEITQQYCPDIEVIATPREKNLGVESGISNVSRLFPNIWIDKKCSRLIESLEKYSRKYNKQTAMYTEPRHDIHSHMADTLRYVCQHELKKDVTISMNQMLINNFNYTNLGF